MSALCQLAGVSRQGFYKQRKKRSRESVDADLVCELVRSLRRVHPRMGGRKLLHVLSPELKAAGVKIGRDRFFEVLRQAGLLVPALPRGPRTTNSRHGHPVYKNRVNELELDGPQQVWVADITYIRTEEGFVYASLLTDAWSRRIVGAHVGVSLETSETLKALRQALLGLVPGGVRPWHHSDRGCQYCSGDYIAALQAHDLGISMTEKNHCAENALAERINGILKQEYWLGGTFRDLADARRALSEAVESYNCLRPHTSLGLRTPMEVHEEGLAR